METKKCLKLISTFLFQNHCRAAIRACVFVTLQHQISHFFVVINLDMCIFFEELATVYKLIHVMYIYFSFKCRNSVYNKSETERADRKYAPTK